MSDSNTNIQFEYLYRDAANYKNYGSVVFANPSNLSIAEIERQIRQHLIDGEFIDIAGLGIPHLYFDNLTENDHTWREFVAVEVTEEKDVEGKVIEAFLEIFNSCRNSLNNVGVILCFND